MKIIRLIIFISLFVTLSQAACENKLFSFSVNVGNSVSSQITIKNILDNIADSCGISLIYQDSKAKDKINKSLSNLNVKDYTLDELLHLLLSDNNLFYTFDNNIISTFQEKASPMILLEAANFISL